MKLFLATGNAHKVRELREFIAELDLAQSRRDCTKIKGALTLYSAAEIGGMPPVVEDTGTFEGNARKKARALAALLPRDTPDAWALADDSGLCVDVLGGAPGVESAYYAGPQADDAANLAKLVAAMRGVPPEQRGAHYVCVFVLMATDGREHVFRGECHGTLAEGPSGQGGFGYDPLFIPYGFDKTFGELPASVKRTHSHRNAAWRSLIAATHALRGGYVATPTCLTATVPHASNSLR